jgi:FixJ family two-component response regulator
MGGDTMFFASAQAFYYSLQATRCARMRLVLVLDGHLPGGSALDARDRTAVELPNSTIFITGHGDIPMSVLAKGRCD